MAGGSGTRFWPYSTVQKPKQFLDILCTGQSLLQQAYNRLLPLCGSDNIYVVTHWDYIHLVMEQLPNLTEEQLLAEPLKKNTAPCLAFCNAYLLEKYPDATVIVTPADHVISHEEEFRRLALLALQKAANSGDVLTFGIRPDKPHTGYGYIETKSSEGDIAQGFSFHEKPDSATALAYLKSGNYYWNSGMFVWTCQRFAQLMFKHAPELALAFRDFVGNSRRDYAALFEVYNGIRGISIDHALMEKLPSFSVVKADIGWSDLGSWTALEEHFTLDQNGNCYPPQIKVLGDARNCIFFSDQKTTFIAPKAEGLIMVATADGNLCCMKEDEQAIKGYTEKMGDTN